MIPGLNSLVYAGSRSNGGLSGNASPANQYVQGTGSTTSGTLTAAPLGGTAPYTYAWSQVSGPAVFTINSPTSATTTITTTLHTGDLLQGIFVCTITDSHPTSVKTNNVTVIFQYG